MLFSHFNSQSSYAFKHATVMYKHVCAFEHLNTHLERQYGGTEMWFEGELGHLLRHDLDLALGQSLHLLPQLVLHLLADAPWHLALSLDGRVPPGHGCRKGAEGAVRHCGRGQRLPYCKTESHLKRGKGASGGIVSNPNWRRAQFGIFLNSSTKYTYIYIHSAVLSNSITRAKTVNTCPPMHYIKP